MCACRERNCRALFPFADAALFLHSLIQDCCADSEIITLTRGSSTPCTPALCVTGAWRRGEGEKGGVEGIVIVPSRGVVLGESETLST